MNKYPKSEDGKCISLTEDENKKLGENLSKLSMSDLLSFRDYCFERQDYFQRRFVKDAHPDKPNSNWHIQERMYSWWLWWFHMTEYVRFTIDEKVHNLVV